MPRPAASLHIELVEEGETTPTPGKGRAYRSRLADSVDRNGSYFQARIEGATGGQGEPREEVKLTVTNLTGLTIEQADRIRKGAWVILKAGYHDRRPSPNTACFFGQLDDLTYELNRGQLLWRLTASGTPGSLYSIRVHRRFEGTRTYAQVFEGLLATVGVAGFNAATVATQHTVTDYSTSGLTLIEEVRDLVLRLRRDARRGDGTEPQVIASPYVGAAGDDVASFILVDLEESFAEAAYRIDLDLAHSAAPEVDSKAIADLDDHTEDDEEVIVSPVSEDTQRYNVVMDFDSNVRNNVLAALFSRRHGISMAIRTDSYVHTVGPGQFQTQLSGEVV